MREELLLQGLRDRLQALCAVPPLPPDWHWGSAMIAAEGFAYGGDFFLADLVDLPEGPALQMVLVDVCGKGDTALPDAVRFADALRGIVGSVPPEAVLTAANTHLLGLPSSEAMATAAQVVIDPATGHYLLRSAGHPPVLRWHAAQATWTRDAARGTALGVTEDPGLSVSEGILGPGESLLFYTDGVVEERGHDIDHGIAWLCDVARTAYLADVATAPARIIEQVPRGDDDRAVLILGRTAP